ncbi:MAG: type II toxin-antitoxin system VapC family toxin [Acidobacteria bacterium]|nr:type II toxin-antitoxin system VapC family toxin [Acidobacteriota bacterium]
MVLDTSAIVAIHVKKAVFGRLIEKIGQAGVVAVGVPTLLESAMVLTSRLSQDARVLLLGSLKRMNAEIVPFTEAHFNVAVEAFLRFGRGRHPAGLNFGDCMAYAVAAVAGLPLLYTGKDFARTDISSA